MTETLLLVVCSTYFPDLNSDGTSRCFTASAVTSRMCTGPRDATWGCAYDLGRTSTMIEQTTIPHFTFKRLKYVFILRSIQSVGELKALYNVPLLTDLFIPTPNRLLLEAF